MKLRPGDLDLSNPKTFVEGVPHDYFRVLREEEPLHFQSEFKIPSLKRGPGFWAVTRYEDVDFISKHAELFSSEAETCFLVTPPPNAVRDMQGQLINMDPPRHTELRNLMNGSFKPSRVKEMESATQGIVNDALDPITGASSCEFVKAVSAPVSLRVLTHFLGVPDSHSKRFFRWTNRLIGEDEPRLPQVLLGRFSLLQLLFYASRLARSRRHKPGDDIYSKLVGSKLGGSPMENKQLGMNFFLLVIAGNETTRNALSGGIQALCEHPDQLALLRSDMSLMPSAIEEMLRWVTPVMQFRRTATQDVKVGNQLVRAGEKVVVYYGSANRDPRVFDKPDEFDITRKPNPHLAFGAGTHFCMGSHMARLEMRLTLTEFLNRFPNVSMTGPAERIHSNFISGIKRLPLALV
jgi:cytochrome P450